MAIFETIISEKKRKAFGSPALSSGMTNPTPLAPSSVSTRPAAAESAGIARGILGTNLGANQKNDGAQQPNVFSPYTNEKLVAAQKTMGSKGIGPLLDGTTRAFDTIKKGADAFAGAMEKNPVASAVNGITNRLSQDRANQQQAVNIFNAPVLKGAADVKTPTSSGVFADAMPNDTLTRGVNLGRVANTNPVSTNPTDSFRVPTAENSTFARGMLFNANNPTRTVYEQDATGKNVVPVERPVSNIARQSFGLPPARNGLTSKTGISMDFAPGADPAAIARSRIVGRENDQRAAYNLTPEGIARENQMVQQFNFQNRGRQFPLRNSTDPVNEFSPGMNESERMARMEINQRSAQSAAQNRAQLEVARMSEGTARERNATDRFQTEAKLGLDRERNDIDRSTAAGQAAERGVNIEGKRMELGKQKRIDDLYISYLSNPDPIKKKAAEDQLLALGVIKKEKPSTWKPHMVTRPTKDGKGLEEVEVLLNELGEIRPMPSLPHPAVQQEKASLSLLSRIALGLGH